MTQQYYGQQNPATFGSIGQQGGAVGSGFYGPLGIGLEGQVGTSYGMAPFNNPYGNQGVGNIIGGINPFATDPVTAAYLQQTQPMGSQLGGIGTPYGRTPYNTDPVTALAFQAQVQQQQLQQLLHQHVLQQQLLHQLLATNVGTPYGASGINPQAQLYGQSGMGGGQLGLNPMARLFGGINPQTFSGIGGQQHLGGGWQQGIGLNPQVGGVWPSVNWGQPQTFNNPFQSGFRTGGFGGY